MLKIRNSPALLALLLIAACGGEGETTSGKDIAPPATTPPSSQMGAPEGLPEHFSLGLANSPTQLSWMIDSGVPWDFRYQYLAGGVNTGNGWTTWNSPPGQFATRYMRASEANGYVPVFTYYQIVQSNPNPGDEDPRSKLRERATMKTYLEDWKVLMEKVGDFGKPVIVHHEPDFWGYVQQSDDDPTKSFVAVDSSGLEEASGFEDNARGLARVFVALRDRYAPNAVLAWHASHWATKVDLFLNDGDPKKLGRRTAEFFNALDADFDLIFVDPSDRDAAFYEIARGDGGARWWDEGDFVTYREFIRVITESTGRSVMLWQVPIGNTLYLSSNNTRGHYQDNRVQYFLGQGDNRHIVEYMRSGVIGILFGRGIGGQSNYVDSENDGITNPEPINGNDLMAEHPDDDGGLLRLGAEAYYPAGPVLSCWPRPAGENHRSIAEPAAPNRNRLTALGRAGTLAVTRIRRQSN